VSRSRLEFLVDGIFAIAITLLVLDLHVPRIADRYSSTELVAELAATRQLSAAIRNGAATTHSLMAITCRFAPQFAVLDGDQTYFVQLARYSFR